MIRLLKYKKYAALKTNARLARAYFSFWMNKILIGLVAVFVILQNGIQHFLFLRLRFPAVRVRIFCLLLFDNEINNRK